MTDNNQRRTGFMAGTISVSVIIIAISVAYYFLVFLPSKERSDNTYRNAQIERLQQDSTIKSKDILTNQQELDSCLKLIDEQQRQAAITLQGKNISVQDAKLIIDAYQQQRNNCYKRYPVN